jgi:hypothetical protein
MIHYENDPLFSVVNNGVSAGFNGIAKFNISAKP